MDETKTQPIGADATTSTSGSGQDTTRAGYCQECGQGLTASSLRRVGANVFCETCATLRQAGGGWQNVPGGSYRGFSAAPGAMPNAATGGPNPVLAGVLGFIPGVGAMFNGQYGKGAMHLIVFVVLVAMADNLNWVLWWLVWGWIFYQVFDAYHTARARRDGMPLPNPFGWNEVGERMGFGRGTSPRPAEPFAVPGPQPTSFGAQASPFANPSPRSAEHSQGSRANWAGYVPPQGNTGPAYGPLTSDPDHNPYTAPYTSPASAPVPPQTPPPTTVPFAPTYTGSTPGPQLVTMPPITGTRRFPLGALWLIGLGVLFLLGNLLPEWRLSGRWFIPIILAVLSFWGAVRRWETYQNAQAVSGSYPNLAGAMVGPVVLLTVSALLALQAAGVLGLGRSWPVLLVVWGTMLLLQRSAALSLPTSTVDELPEPIAPPVRSTSGTGSLGL